MSVQFRIVTFWTNNPTMPINIRSALLLVWPGFCAISALLFLAGIHPCMMTFEDEN